MFEIVAPKVGGRDGDDGTLARRADQKIDGAPSVLYDAVAIVASRGRGRAARRRIRPRRTSSATRYAHGKFIGHSDAATALFDAVGLGGKVDGGFVELGEASSVGAFLESCAQLRCWGREAALA